MVPVMVRVNQVNPMTRIPKDRRIMTSQKDRGMIMEIGVEENRAMLQQRREHELLSMVKW
jgi:hypothetical protein